MKYNNYQEECVEKLDFSNCEIDEFTGYDGVNGVKNGIWYNNKLYMLKKSSN